MGIKSPKGDNGNASDLKYYKECAAFLPFSMEIPVTETIVTSKKELTLDSIIAGRYKIIEEEGRGSMIVFRQGN
jgi:hypothetical protein